jgi:hypothetical protein
MYDAEHCLLYVGLTGDPPARTHQHKGDKSWWHEVATITIEHCESREDLQAREIAAIRDEHPRYNQAIPRYVWSRGSELLNPTRSTPAFYVHDDRVCTVCDTKFTGFAGSKYCSEACKKQAAHDRWVAERVRLGLPATPPQVRPYRRRR